VRLNIQFEITYSTTVFEFNTTTALVVLMERCNFVSAGRDKGNGTFHFVDNLSRGVPQLLCERRGIKVKKLTVKLIIGGSRPTEVLPKETYLLNIFLASQFIRKFQNY